MDALGHPLHVLLSGGNIHDISVAKDVLHSTPLDHSIVMADKAYVAREFREEIEHLGCTYCIPPKSNEKEQWEVDWQQYKERNKVERFFQKLKQYRRIATRYDKLAERFLAFVHLACMLIWLM